MEFDNLLGWVVYGFLFVLSYFMKQLRLTTSSKAEIVLNHD
jgi:hypothetical protein